MANWTPSLLGSLRPISFITFHYLNELVTRGLNFLKFACPQLSLVTLSTLLFNMIRRARPDYLWGRLL